MQLLELLRDGPLVLLDTHVASQDDAPAAASTGEPPSTTVSKKNRLLESLLAATDAEIAEGGSAEQLQALSDRLPGLKSHLATLLASEGGAVPARAPPP